MGGRPAEASGNQLRVCKNPGLGTRGFHTKEPYFMQLSTRIVPELRTVGNAELLAAAESLEYQLEDLEELYGGDPVAKLEMTDILDAIDEVLTWRHRLHLRNPDLLSPLDTRYDAWRDLAREVCQRADIVKIFADAGWVLSFAGRNSQRNCEEYAGPCFACGGRDRFRVWTNGTYGGGYWCRGCRISGDVITAYRNLQNTSFFDTVLDLARKNGVPTGGVAEMSDGGAKKIFQGKRHPSRMSIEVGS